MKHTIQFICCLCTLIFPGAFDAYGQVDAEQVTRIGRNVMAMDDYLLSIQYFNQAIKAKPYLSDPYYFRGLAKLMLDDYQGAEEDCTLALERNKFRYEAYRVRGFARMKQDKDSLAIEDFNAGLVYRPDDQFFLFYKALAQTDREDYDAADTTFSQLLRLYPKFEDGLAAQSRMLLMKGDTIKAYEVADNALKVSPNLLYPYLVKADIAQSRQQWKEAEESLTEALRLEPRETSLYINRAFMRYNDDDLFGAMADYNYAIDLDPTNRAAIYNRALLRMQVYDLTNALNDFGTILEWDPGNFPARYNRVLININFENYQPAISDLRYILRKYPRFYQGYYTLAEIYRRLGNEKLFYENFHKANDIATRYVKDYKHYDIDRPSIEPGSSLSVSKDDMSSSFSPDETETDLTTQLNRLITISHDKDISEDQTLGKKSRISGKIQDTEIPAEPQPLYAFTLTDPKNELRPASNFFRELESINSDNNSYSSIYLSNEPGSQNDLNQMTNLFSFSEKLDQKESENMLQPSDYFIRGVIKTLLKNYEGALSDLDKAVEGSPNFAAPLFERAYTSLLSAEMPSAISEEENTVSKSGTSTSVAQDRLLEEASRNAKYRNAINDLDKALKIDPRLAFAWYNKGCIFYAMREYTEALQCFSEAIKINPDFGNAWYNRALTYLHLGNREEAKSGLSKAGELGVVSAYNILKRLK